MPVCYVVFMMPVALQVQIFTQYANVKADAMWNITKNAFRICLPHFWSLYAYSQHRLPVVVNVRCCSYVQGSRNTHAHALTADFGQIKIFAIHLAQQEQRKWLRSAKYEAWHRQKHLLTSFYTSPLRKMVQNSFVILCFSYQCSWTN